MAEGSNDVGDKRLAAERELARARAFDAKRRTEDARRAYLEALRHDSAHFDALSGLGSLLARTGRSTEAKAVLKRAVEAKPNRSSAHYNLAILLADDPDPTAATDHFKRATELDPTNPRAFHGLATLALRHGQLESAHRYARLGRAGRAEAWPFRGKGEPIVLLYVQSSLGGNVPVDPLLDDTVFQKWTLSAEFYDAEAELPPHALLFNGVGDADRSPLALEATAQVISRTRAPVLNPPERVRATARAANAERLRQIPGVVAAQTAEWSRESLLSPTAIRALADAGFCFPLLLRSPGFHTGEHFVKVDEPSQLKPAVDLLPGASVLVIQFLNTVGTDGHFRKYRVMMIDGRLYPLHLAVSTNWKVHYFSADMTESPEHRAEDEAFLKDMRRTLGGKALQALRRIQNELGLDYGGIDFTVDREGRVVVFEANATMRIVAPADDARWRYRVAPVKRAQAAVRRMLRNRATASTT